MDSYLNFVWFAFLCNSNWTRSSKECWTRCVILKQQSVRVCLFVWVCVRCIVLAWVLPVLCSARHAPLFFRLVTPPEPRYLWFTLPSANLLMFHPKNVNKPTNLSKSWRHVFAEGFSSWLLYQWNVWWEIVTWAGFRSDVCGSFNRTVEFFFVVWGTR